MKLLGFIFVSLFLFSFASASSTYTVQHDYYNDNTHVKTVYYTLDKTYQENPNRYPVYDYRDGYTYRTSKEYLEQKYDNSKQSLYYRNSNERNGNSGKITYYNYDPYMRSYEEKTCYDSPPKGKLFYIKCDF